MNRLSFSSSSARYVCALALLVCTLACAFAHVAWAQPTTTPSTPPVDAADTAAAATLAGADDDAMSPALMTMMLDYEIEDTPEYWSDDYEAASLEEQVQQQQLQQLQQLQQASFSPSMMMQGTLQQAQAQLYQQMLQQGYTASPFTYPRAYGAIYRNPKTVRSPVLYERAQVPVMASTTTTKQAAPLTREALQERASPIVQSVTPQVSMEQAPVQFERATVPLMTSTTTTKQAAPIVREALSETAQAIRQEVQLTAPKVEEAPVQYERATVPVMASSTTTTTAKQAQLRAPLEETAAPVIQTVHAEAATFEQAPVQYERATVPVLAPSTTVEQAAPVVQPAVYEQRDALVQELPASSTKKNVA